MKIYASPNLTMVGHMKNILINNDIPCAIRNEGMGNILGGVPLIRCWPELWIQDDAHEQHAKQLIQDALDPQETNAAPWTCPTCQEQLEAQFTLCWNCGTELPDQPQT